MDWHLIRIDRLGGRGSLPAEVSGPLVIHTKSGDKNVDNRNGEYHRDDNIVHCLRPPSILFPRIVKVADKNQDYSYDHLFFQNPFV